MSFIEFPEELETKAGFFARGRKAVVATVATFIGMASLSVGNAASDGILTWGEAAPLLVIAAGGSLVAGSAVWTTSNAR